MALLDWAQVFGAATGKSYTYGLADLWGGKFSVEIGQSLSGYLIGGRQTHILGQELKLVCDPESFYTPASTIGMAAATLLLGSTGKSELYFGRNMGSTYIGPKFDIKRCPASFDKRVKTLLADPGFATKATDPIDKIAAAACAVMSLITVGVMLGLDIAAKIQYGDGKNPQALFALLNTLSLSLTSRLMSLLELIEIKCGWVNAGEGFLAAGKIFLKFVGVLLLTAIAIPAALLDGVTQGTLRVGDAFIAATNALSNW
jgi:hypothetical protein